MAKDGHSTRDPSLVQPTDSELELTPEREEAFCRLISERTGIVVRDGQLTYLRTSVRDACRRFNYSSSQNYLNALHGCSETSRELEHLIADITVGESYFFRDAEQTRYLSDGYLPTLIDRRRRTGNQMLRIWSAGCSLGQEIYTVAIMLEELLPDLDQWTVHLLATDINTESLRQAIKGRYSGWSLRSTTEQRKSRYFKRHRGGDFELLRRIRRRVRFTYQNLSEDNFPSVLSETYAQDLILCRNVLIYLDNRNIAAIMKKFAASLLPDGVLLLGACDPHIASTPGLIAAASGRVHYYARAQPDTEIGRSTGEPARSSAGPTLRPTPPPSVAPDRLAARAPARAAAKKTVPASPTAAPASVRPPTEEVNPEIKALLNEERWSDALQAIEDVVQSDGESSLLFQLKAKALANLGHLDEAVAACGLSQALDPGDKHSYLIQAMGLQGLERLPEAEVALRRALYLDHEFVEAHYQLALLLYSTGRTPEGSKSLSNALRLAERGDPERRLHDASGMTYARFVEILQNEFDIYSGLTDRE